MQPCMLCHLGSHCQYCICEAVDTLNRCSDGYAHALCSPIFRTSHRSSNCVPFICRVLQIIKKSCGLMDRYLKKNPKDQGQAKTSQAKRVQDLLDEQFQGLLVSSRCSAPSDLEQLEVNQSLQGHAPEQEQGRQQQQHQQQQEQGRQQQQQQQRSAARQRPSIHQITAKCKCTKISAACAWQGSSQLPRSCMAARDTRRVEFAGAAKLILCLRALPSLF